MTPKHLRDVRGISNLGMLLTVLIVAVGVYVAAQVFPMYYSYWELQGQFEAQAEKAQVHNNKKIREYLVNEMRKMNIPAEPEDLIIRRRGRTIEIDLEYEDVLTFPNPRDPEEDYELWVFEFNPYIEQEY